MVAPTKRPRRRQASGERPDHTEEVVKSARKGEPFSHVLYRGEGLDEREKARGRVPAQFAVGEHWTPDPKVALSYGPDLREETVSLSSPYVFRLGKKGPYFEDMRREFGTSDPRIVTALLREMGHDGLIVLGVAVLRSYSRGGSVEVVKFGGSRSPRHAGRG